MFTVLQFVFKLKKTKWRRLWNEAIQFFFFIIANEVTCQWPRIVGLVNKACPCIGYPLRLTLFTNTALHLPHTHTLATNNDQASSSVIIHFQDATIYTGSLQSLDWTGGLDWWTGLVD